ncbi:hypothetical protein E2562_019651 [Oryza meyeriana var. granulata]|uniref:Uncharacterized protein n=1 Tax=Oryza meyeriana var. granulata TaxID=110450 RepID=A0A6G1C6R0_9ORYZ|nr:hypothetical protein E2562_019651 [Oryza meyeriana var. granulata]
MEFGFGVVTWTKRWKGEEPSDGDDTRGVGCRVLSYRGGNVHGVPPSSAVELEAAMLWWGGQASG